MLSAMAVIPRLAGAPTTRCLRACRRGFRAPWRSCLTLLALPFGVLSRLPGRLFFEQRQDLARPDELCLGLLEVLFADSRLATSPAGWRPAVPGARRRVLTAALLLFRAVPITPIFLAAAPTPPQTVGRGFRARPPAAPPPSGHSAVP